MNDDLKKPQLRALQYQHVDGTVELTFGGLFLLMAIFSYVVGQISLPNSLLSNILLPFASWLVFIGGVFLIDRLIQLFRERVTYPRTGYIAYRRQPQPLERTTTRLTILIGVPLLTVTLLLLVLNRSKFPAQGQDSVSSLMPGLGGLLFSGLWVLVGWKIALPRFYLVAAASLLVGTGLLVSGVGGNLGMASLFGAESVFLFASGGVTLWKYLRSTRSPQDGQSAE